MADDVESDGVRGARTAQISPTRAPGRPRTVPVELSPSDRAIAWRNEWEALGGHRIAVNLGPEAWHALQQLARKRERSALVERLILREYAATPQLARVSGSGRPRAPGRGSRPSRRGE